MQLRAIARMLAASSPRWIAMAMPIAFLIQNPGLGTFFRGAP